MIRTSRRGSSRQGFLLMEVLLAGAILGIALIVINIAAARCVRGISVCDSYRTAFQVLDERRKIFDTGTEFRQGVWDGSVESNGRTFTWKHEIKPTDHPQLYKEVIRVEWKMSDGVRDETWEGYRWSER